MRAWVERAKQSTAWRVLARAAERWAEEDGDQRAAGLTYFLLLSLAPLILILVILGSLLVERQLATQQVVRWIEHYVPLTQEQEDSAVVAVHAILKDRGKTNLVAFALLVWGALKFLRAWIRTTNRIWRTEGYSWWRLPLKSLSLLGITVSAALIGILLPVIARLARRGIQTLLDIPDWAFGLSFSLIPWFVLFYGILMAYKLAPSRDTKFSEVWISALAATILIWAGERLFLLYATNFARFNMLYGTLGGAIAFLLWTYLSSRVCVFGTCVSAALVEEREG